MSDFNNLKQGDILLRTARQFGCGGYGWERFSMTEWIEMEIERVTPKFYFINGEKFDKASCGKHFMRRHYIPGSDGAPLKSNTAEFEYSLELYGKLLMVDQLTRVKLEKLSSLEKAAYFAEKIISLCSEVDREISISSQ